MSESWIQILSLFLANAALIIWFRAESRADWRLMDQKTDNMRKESREDWKMIHQELKEFKDAVRIEMKDFHKKPLKGERKGQRSIRLNKAYRAIYIENELKEIVIISIVEVNKHEY